MVTFFTYLARFLVGGLLVCVFAFVSEMFRPKEFAGLFSAAPSILLAGIVITLLTQGATHAALTAEGAIAGALGMICYCLLVIPLTRRYKVLMGVVLSLSGWFLVSFAAFVLLRVLMGWSHG